MCIPLEQRPSATEFLMEDEMRLANINDDRASTIWRKLAYLLAATLMSTAAFYQLAFAAAAQQRTFPTAADAVKAAIAAAKNNDDKELLAIFGAQAKDLISSGDALADKQRRAQFIKAFDEKNRLVVEGESTIVVIGKNEWPFPIPLVKKGESWVFDTAKGREEVLNRRIGDNELSAIQVSLAYFDAQREFAQKDRDGDGLLEYAQKFRSDSGKKNGLYWEAKTGDEVSPLGPFAVRAVKEGYAKAAKPDKPAPYHGYFYRILSAQGKDAPGGAFSYMVKGNMIGGFALVAYPAEYGNSGVMSFIVNHNGKVFQKDLGKNTASVASTMKEYNPDSTWTEVKQ
jgi:hypothetical protein